MYEHHYYVSNSGNDQWSGSLPAPNAGHTDGPFATLKRARDVLRELKAAGQFIGPVKVMVVDGTYYLSEPLVFESQDSGTANCPITITAYPGDKPTLSGGRRITEWKPYQGQIMQSALPEAKGGRWKFRQLFFNSERQVRARWPNRDENDPLYGGWAFIEETLNPSTFRYECDTSPKKWAKPEQAELSIFPWYCWLNDLLPIAEVDPSDRTIRIGGSLYMSFMAFLPGNRFIIENVLEELDQPGEWCLDSETGVLYFWPPDGSVEEGEVVVPVTDCLIELRGTDQEPIRHINISGLTFTQTLSPFPEQLHPTNFHSPCLRGEAIRLENAEDCRIERNVFRVVGGDGVRFHGDNSRNKVLHNEISYSGGAGISLSSNSEGNTTTWTDKDVLIQQSKGCPKLVRNVISHNHIHHCGILKKNCGGVQLFGINSIDNIISHNHIHHTSDKGMVMQDGFGRFIVEYNHLHDIALEIADTGGIMTNRWFVLEGDEELGNGNIFRYNLIQNVIGCGGYGEPREGKSRVSSTSSGKLWIPYYTWGIYFDNSGMHSTVYGNIIIGTVLGGVSIPVGDPKDNLFENNILVDCIMQQADLRIGGQSATGNRFVRNILYYTDLKSALFFINSRTKQAFAECDYNLYASPGDEEPAILGSETVQTLNQWRELGFDTHSVVADPLFVDPANGDYRLKPSSPAFALGFRPIDVSWIGPQS